MTFFGDGALETFLSTYLRRTLAGGVLLSGIGLLAQATSLRLALALLVLTSLAIAGLAT